MPVFTDVNGAFPRNIVIIFSNFALDKPNQFVYTICVPLLAGVIDNARDTSGIFIFFRLQVIQMYGVKRAVLFIYKHC